jgi:isoleucyl-tRNA synthetase
MSAVYKEYQGLDLPNVAERVLEKWAANKTFEASISSREGAEPFVFFEGPPSANGLPGIHHVMARAIKDIFCRYQTLQGRKVERKAGWDTHGLPVELGVEKELGISKEDIGKKISVDDYNKVCREAVMRYTDIWNQLTLKMGYWVDMEEPYVTYDSKYMESVWWLLSQLYSKNLIYKGYTIQPYSPAAGTGLSSHEINQPGCYRDVKDTTVVAQFKVTTDSETFSDLSFGDNTYFLAWTTTPWTLPSNTALCVGTKIEYALVRTYNVYSHEEIQVVLAKELVLKHFGKGYLSIDSKQEFDNYDKSGKNIPFEVIGIILGSKLVGLRYEQLIKGALPFENEDAAFQVIAGDFVTTSDGTGIVHIAPTFGADDARVAKESNIPAMLVLDENNNPVPLVDLKGRLRPETKDPLFGLAGEYVKADYLSDIEKQAELVVQKDRLKSIIPDLKAYLSVDERIALKLKLENKAFKIEKYEHSYPHCWRTDKPVLYYPLDSWFIKVTDVKGRMLELNNTINWKPASTGTGRFGEWLKNANDWNLSRSRYWGIPIPIWSTEDGEERICVSSIEELKNESEKSVEAGFMHENPLKQFTVNDFSKENYARVDLHKNYMDEIILVSPSGKPMKREADLIDVWFDSGSMPYAQWHYPFENKEFIDSQKSFPADFIAEGVDQTRGWFYTLHAISTMCFDSVAYKNVISNGLVLDKNGQKMSKRLGNTIEPFETLATYGPDATRWYMITNAQPWDNLKFDLSGITEVQRKFFGTLYNTYSFFTLYANIDGFKYEESEIDLHLRPEIDRWIISKLNSLILSVNDAYSTYDPTRAGRLIQDFVSDQLSNWYVRLCRRRFWKGEYTQDKISAYQTLYTCLESISIMASPIAPFYMDQLFSDLNEVSGRHKEHSVHLAYFPKANSEFIDDELEAQMAIAQNVSSLVLGLRKKEKIRVRQPLQKIMVPATDSDFVSNIQHVKELILSEVNVKELELLNENNTVFIKCIKPNFRSIGQKYPQQMKGITTQLKGFGQEEIARYEKIQGVELTVDGIEVKLSLHDVEIIAEDIPGWLVASENGYTVALDHTITETLKQEGIARELVNRVQNLRKDSGLEVTDRISLKLLSSQEIMEAIRINQAYICDEVLANDIVFEATEKATVIDLLQEGDAKLSIHKV